ncbi:MAG: hypothetical protein K0R02_1017 [Rickettsiaceae bacterium]|nr:hypothetical protein [Rickettsiaceae bacterium]
MEINFDALEKYIYKNIPISLSLGVKIDDATSDEIILTAPLEANINHKNTVFGGSLHSVATLACWSLLYINIQKYYESCEIVISSSKIDYKKPVKEDFSAICVKPNETDWEKFIKMLDRKGKGRISLKAKIYQGDSLAVDYLGEFVVIKV